MSDNNPTSSSNPSSPTPFDDPAVEQILRNYRREQGPSKPSISKFREFMTKPHSFELQVSRDNAERSSISSKKITPSIKTLDKTPETRRGLTLEIGRHYPVAWLLFEGGLCCAVTGRPPAAHLVVQFAHILLPQRVRINDSVLSWYEYMMGMKPQSLSIDSRLFLMPLSVELHCVLDDHLILFLPDLETFQAMVDYIRLVEEKRQSLIQARKGATKASLEAGMGSMTLDDLEDLWTPLRSGELEGKENFKAGNFHRYIIAFHPRLHPSLRPSQLCFESHVAPLAVLLNALWTLKRWAKGDLHPTVPIAVREMQNAEPCSPATLEAGMRASEYNEDLISRYAFLWRLLYTYIQELEDSYAAYRKMGDDGPAGGGGQLGDKGGRHGDDGGGSRDHKDLFEDKDELGEFGNFGPLHFDEKSANQRPSQLPPEYHQNDVDSDVLYYSSGASHVASEAMSTHSEEGVIVPEPDNSSPTSPSPAELVAKEYYHQAELRAPSTSSRSYIGYLRKRKVNKVTEGKENRALVRAVFGSLKQSLPVLHAFRESHIRP